MDLEEKQTIKGNLQIADELGHPPAKPTGVRFDEDQLHRVNDQKSSRPRTILHNDSARDQVSVI